MLKEESLFICNKKNKTVCGKPSASKLNTDKVHGICGTANSPQGGLTYQAVLLRLVVFKLDRPAFGCHKDKIAQEDVDGEIPN